MNISRIVLASITLIMAAHLRSRLVAGETPVPPHLSAEVSWIGNTWKGNPDWVPQDIDDLFVAPSGDIFTNVPWEEGGGNVTHFAADGSWKGVAKHTHGWGFEGGSAVCANATYVFIASRGENEGGGLVDAGTWPPKGLSWLGVSRRQRADIHKAAPFPGGKGGKGDTLQKAFLVVAEVKNGGPAEALRGLVANEKELFVSLRGQGCVQVYDCEKMQLLRTLPLPRADRIALAQDGRVWALQAPEGAGAWQIVGLDPTSGAEIARFHCDDGWLPADLAIAPDGRLYVTDTGADQQIKVLDDLAAAKPRLAESIGAKGGIFAGPVPGATGPLRFNQPRGVGLDAAGNLYVANDGTTAGGGTVLECYGPARELRWQRHGLHFVDLPDIDPSGRTVYTKEEIYALDLSKPAGEQWNYRAYTCDSRRFPDDPRAHGGHTNAWFRELSGQPFLFTSGMSSPFLAVYRFDRKSAGEIAIPCAYFSRTGKGKSPWPAAAPEKGGWRWQDLNGDGAMQAGEFAANDRDGNNVQGMFPITPDASGRLWWGFSDEIRAYAFTGLTHAGLPQWDWSKPFIFPRPAEFDQLRRVGYDPASDLMVLGGDKGKDKHQHWKPMGPVVSAYDNVLRGKPALRWTKTLPFGQGSSGHESAEPMGFDIAGDYLFVPYTRGLKSEGLRNAFVKVLRLSDGSVAGNLVCEDVTGEIGLLDLETAAIAHRLPDGRYVILLEDDYKAKTVMFIWKPNP
ncbi:MAG TPA: hypothetical protein VKX17_14975 [Planctomycetota bacterium]|nr:hypothetical protein [Planctomycetota bacterium]